jgi:uncharacterized protein (DUF1810 family)
MTTIFDDHDLKRFIDAQDGSTSTRVDMTAFEAAIEELRNGKKVGHWIWFIFPQIEIGQSEMARKYAIKSLTEAEDFLRHPILHDRLLSAAEIVNSQLRSGVHPEVLLGGYIDCLKLSSSMTLFKNVSIQLNYDLFLKICTDNLDQLSKHSIGTCRKTEDWFSEKGDSYSG